MAIKTLTHGEVNKLCRISFNCYLQYDIQIQIQIQMHSICASLLLWNEVWHFPTQGQGRRDTFKFIVCRIAIFFFIFCFFFYFLYYRNFENNANKNNIELVLLKMMLFRMNRLLLQFACTLCFLWVVFAIVPAKSPIRKALWENASLCNRGKHLFSSAANNNSNDHNGIRRPYLVINKYIHTYIHTWIVVYFFDFHFCSAHMTR